MLTVDSCPTSESPFDSSGHVIVQFLRSLQCSLNPDNFHLAGRDLSGRFAVTSRSHQATLVAGQHAPKDRRRTFLRPYRWAGANATLALLLNGVLLVAALSCFGAVLTLPGIAGAVLTIGMAVDSNVLIFERIREELRAGRSSAGALTAGFSKAFATLVDTHVTTVVSCVFLFFLGTPAVKGIRNDSGNRSDDKPVHIRLRFTSSVRLGVVEARTIPAIEHWDIW